MLREQLVFLKQFVKNPAQISSVIPSSAELARVMAAVIDPAKGPVAEFGPGTGIITRALLARGVAPQDLTLMEMSDEFCTHLRRAFPDVTLHNRPAQDITLLTDRKFNAVVSGLPLLSMRPDIQAQIISAAFDILQPDGIYVQFTYGRHAPVNAAVAQTLGLTHRKTAWVWRNVPPASVYVYTRLPH